jgi:serine/threonine-protein kinase
MPDPRILETKCLLASDCDSGPFDFADLDTRTRRDAERSLSVAAFVYAAGYFAGYFIIWGVRILTTGFCMPPPQSLAIALLSIAGSIVVGVVARRGGLPAVRFTPLAVGYCVLGSLGIEASSWNWREFLEAGAPTFGLSWIGVWVVAFPNLVTLCPSSVLRAGILSALCLPAVALLSFARDGWPAVDGSPAYGSALAQLAQLTVPLLACAGLATFMAARVFRMARDVTNARRLGNYELVERIGGGGMGEVWKAKHRLLARPAAVKIIRPGASTGTPPSAGATLARRFEREAQATAALTSANTVAIYDFGTNEDGAFYYVMELLEGMDLRTLVEKTGPVPSARAIRFLRQALASLADAHASGLIHRDVKPANLYLCRRGLELDVVKVLDFGLVKDFADGSGSQLTADGITSGTPAFMAPEMALGSSGVDARADLYALGCVAYWLLAGRLVFEGPTALSILVQHAKEQPLAPSRVSELDVDPELERLVLDLLAKRPDERPAGALEVDRRLAAIEQRIGAWTQERAERWWRAHLPHLVATRAPAHEAALPAAAAS